MRFLIFGAGAVGSVMGAYLALHGFDVALVGNKNHANAINRRGLELKGILSENVGIRALPNLKRFVPAQGDVILLSVKAYDSTKALKQLRKTFPARTPIFCVQNGIRTEACASRFFRNVYGVTVCFGASFLKPGEVVHTSDNRIVVGRYPGGVDDNYKTICEIFRTCGLVCATSKEIMKVKWQKLLCNLNSATLAILDKPYQEAVGDAKTREFMAGVIEEGQRILDAAQISASGPFFSTRGVLESIRNPPNRHSEFPNYPSMWQDLRLGRKRNEIDFLNGEIVRLGKRLGIKTPLNSLLTKLVKAKRRNRNGALRNAISGYPRNVILAP